MRSIEIPIQTLANARYDHWCMIIKNYLFVMFGRGKDKNPEQTIEVLNLTCGTKWKIIRIDYDLDFNRRCLSVGQVMTFHNV